MRSPWVPTGEFDWNVLDNFDGDLVGADVETNKAVLVRLRNPSALAKSRGAVASFATALAPATIEGKVYDELASQLRDKLRAQNIDADVSVVDPRAWQPTNGAHLATDLGYAIGGAGILAAIFWLVTRGKK